MSLTAIILTNNEAKHLPRAMASVASFATEVVVVDSHSTDRTQQLAQAAGARVFERRFRNYADQFRFALDETGITSDWILRLDADEIIHEDLAESIRAFLANPPVDVAGVILQRRHIWMGRWVRFGGRYPLNLVRIWRRGQGRVEMRWMDEHVVVSGGRIITLHGGFSDWNLNDLSYFTDKHNGYATREAIDVLDARYGLFETDHELAAQGTGRQASIKRLLKNKIYNKLPFWLAPLLYFVWRFVFQLGFLDGRSGLVYHVLQGFWYRFLVGAKVVEFDAALKPLKSREERLLKLQEMTGRVLRP
ncbi:MAG: glycosyltransferase family 2 protein [Burkholderiales bacterium]|nr:glycosyltransferase family 2 protein [Burkholderiales bacterium]